MVARLLTPAVLVALSESTKRINSFRLDLVERAELDPKKVIQIAHEKKERSVGAQLRAEMPACWSEDRLFQPMKRISQTLMCCINNCQYVKSPVIIHNKSPNLKHDFTK